MRTLLLFIVPPVAGAIIAYVTNVIAIKMLFRPLKEIRIFGIRLPFTPGILPKQRGRLAQSIGGMVERELLTPEILRQRLAKDEVRERIKETLSQFTENLLYKTPGELLTVHENILSEKTYSAIEKLYPVVFASVMKFISRDEIRRELESRGRVILRNIILKLNVFQRFFLSAAQYDQTLREKMPEIIDDLANNAEILLQDEKVKRILIKTASDSFCRMITGNNEKLGLLLNFSDEDKKALDDFLFQYLMNAADRQIENLLVSINIKALVSERIDSLDMLRVERIILDVMSDQFKWIHIFGGILGFFIGTFQALFSFFMRVI